MKAPVIEKRFHDANPVASLNRHALGDAGVFTISLGGGPGSGKTSLIEATLRRLADTIHIGVIACDVTSQLDADRMNLNSEQVVQINTGEQGAVDATHIRDALQWLDLKWLQILFIENVGTLVGPAAIDLGQDATVALFSVAGGHDKPSKHPELVRAADLVLLNKTDLLKAVPFDIDAFRNAVRQINPRAELIEISALHGEGMERWVGWLGARVRKHQGKSAQWFG